MPSVCHCFQMHVIAMMMKVMIAAVRVVESKTITFSTIVLDDDDNDVVVVDDDGDVADDDDDDVVWMKAPLQLEELHVFKNYSRTIQELH